MPSALLRSGLAVLGCVPSIRRSTGFATTTQVYVSVHRPVTTVAVARLDSRPPGTHQVTSASVGAAMINFGEIINCLPFSVVGVKNYIHGRKSVRRAESLSARLLRHEQSLCPGGSQSPSGKSTLEAGPSSKAKKKTLASHRIPSG
jgi:hypothetical protein